MSLRNAILGHRPFHMKALECEYIALILECLRRRGIVCRGYNNFRKHFIQFASPNHQETQMLLFA